MGDSSKYAISVRLIDHLGSACRLAIEILTVCLYVHVCKV